MVDDERPIDLSRTNLTGAALVGATLTDGSLTDEQLASAEGTDEITTGIRDALPHLKEAARKVLAERHGQQRPDHRVSPATTEGPSW